jgi:hypothetical protein
MAILKKEKVIARESTSTHFPNETTKAPEDSDQAALNHQVPETLIDPEDDEGGSTHFSNEEEYNKKSKRMNANAQTAAQRIAATKAPKHPGIVPLAKESAKKHPAKTKAGLDENDSVGEDDPDFVQGPDADGDFGAGSPDSGTGVAADADRGALGEPESGLQDTQHLPNNEDPTAGYLTVGTEGEAPTSELELAPGENPQSGLETPAPAATVEAEDMNADDVGDVVEEFDDAPAPAAAPEDLIDDEEIDEMAPAPEDMALMDVDGADDECDDVVFANIGTSVKVIKANRIIASMSKKVAVKAGHEDVYLGDQFQEVTNVEMSKHGVRAGLIKMGFVLATVNLGKAEVLNKRVQAKAEKLTAGVRSQHAEALQSMDQCLAIAAVGINNGYFKNTRNELAASLEEELATAGVRGAKAMVKRIFASKGVDFAKAILTQATKLSALSEEARNQHAAALDMVSEEGMEGPEGDEDGLFGDSASPDFQRQLNGADEGAGSDEFIDHFEDDSHSPETVHAALQRPATPVRRSYTEVSAKSAGYSAEVQAVLAGKKPFGFQ